MHARLNSYRTHTLIGVIFCILIGAGGRILLEGAPNIETIMLVSILASALFGYRIGLVVSLASIAISDVIIGNTSILFYTWSAWALIAFLAGILQTSDTQKWSFVFKATGMGVLGTLVFYLWTNFGVWMEGFLYPSTISGLIESYTMALPFLRLHLLSTLTIVPVGAALVVLLMRTSWSSAVLPNATQGR